MDQPGDTGERQGAGQVEGAEAEAERLRRDGGQPGVERRFGGQVAGPIALHHPMPVGDGVDDIGGGAFLIVVGEVGGPGRAEREQEGGDGHQQPPPAPAEPDVFVRGPRRGGENLGDHEEAAGMGPGGDTGPATVATADARAGWR